MASRGEIDLNFDTTENPTQEQETAFEADLRLMEQAANAMERARLGMDEEMESPEQNENTFTLEIDESAKTAITKTSKTSSRSSRNKKPMTKGQLVKALAARTGQPASVIREVLNAHEAVGVVELKKTGAFRIPGLAHLKVKAKPAKPERYGYNPLTRQHQTFAAKPASMGVKARADTKMKKYVKPIQKPIIWDQKSRKKLEERINSMSIKKNMSKAQIIDHLCHKTKLPRHDIEKIFDLFGELCIRELATRGSFKIPDIASLRVNERAAAPERMGLNPFTKQMTTFKARPATKNVKASITKGLRSICYAFTDAKSYASSYAASSTKTLSNLSVEQSQEQMNMHSPEPHMAFPMKKNF